MKVSLAWLQTYFDTPLPSADDIVRELTFKAFEIEGTEKTGDDTILDVNVLPNRNHDCLSHRGIAHEIATLFSLEMNDPLRDRRAEYPASKAVSVKIDDEKLCDRYIGLVIRGVKIGPSPDWLKDRLEGLGQRSINNVVDATNVVMLSVGQPLHAFDLAKLAGEEKAVRVRSAKDGEKITTLGGGEYELNPNHLLIADGNGGEALGIAGVKGGTAAEISEETTDILLESAHFDYVSIRKTAQALKLWTDASVRFQNDPSPELAGYGMDLVTKLILDIAGGEVEGVVDVYPEPQQAYTIEVSTAEVNDLLGTTMNDGNVEEILGHFGFSCEKKGEAYVVSVPFERLDLRIKEDIIEEIGRIYGYEKITPELPTFTKQEGVVDKEYFFAERVREALTGLGFSEIYTTSFHPDGDIELANSVAPERRFLRTNLRNGIEASLTLNLHNLDLLGLDRVLVFEIGTVFTKDGEYTALAIGARSSVKKENVDAIVDGAVEKVAQVLGTKLSGETKDGVWEDNVSDATEDIAEPTQYDHLTTGTEQVKYAPFSIYPFIARDIALWVPEGVFADDVEKIISEHAGELLVKKPRLFDTFTKTFDDGTTKTSYAFRLVFQSYDRTLTDGEVNDIMAAVTSALQQNEGWEVR